LDRQHYRWAFFIIVFILASVYFFIFSESGLLQRIVLDKEKTAIAANIETLKSDNMRLQRLLNKYRKGEYPEREIADSGYVKNGGSVLMFRGAGKKPGDVKTGTVQSGDLPVPLMYMRLAWMAVSASIIIALVVLGIKFNDRSS
jgi:hypothetical protein